MRSLHEEDSSLKFYYPGSLLRMVNDTAFSRKRLSEYFLHNAYPAEPGEIHKQLQENLNILSGFEARSQDIDRHSYIYIRICVKTYLIWKNRLANIFWKFLLKNGFFCRNNHGLSLESRSRLTASSMQDPYACSLVAEPLIK